MCEYNAIIYLEIIHIGLFFYDFEFKGLPDFCFDALEERVRFREPKASEEEVILVDKATPVSAKNKNQ